VGRCWNHSSGASMTKTIRVPSFEESNRTPGESSATRRLLSAFGIDPTLVDCIIGDLAEERAERSARHGRFVASAWCAEQAIRSARHLLVAAYRHGGLAARARLCGAVGVVLIGLASLGAALVLRDGPAARIVAALANSDDGIVVNNVSAVQLPL